MLQRIRYGIIEIRPARAAARGLHAPAHDVERVGRRLRQRARAAAESDVR